MVVFPYGSILPFGARNFKPTELKVAEMGSTKIPLCFMWCKSEEGYHILYPLFPKALHFGYGGDGTVYWLLTYGF